MSTKLALVHHAYSESNDVENDMEFDIYIHQPDYPSSLYFTRFVTIMSNVQVKINTCKLNSFASLCFFGVIMYFMYFNVC